MHVLLVLGNQKDPASASEIYDRALSYNPAIFRVISKNWARSRRALARKAEPGEAVRILEETLEADPGDVETRFALGGALETAGKPDDAVPHYAAASRHAPPPAPATLAQLRDAAKAAISADRNPPLLGKPGTAEDKVLATDHFVVLYKCDDWFARDLADAAEFHLLRMGRTLSAIIRWESAWTEKARLVVLDDMASYRRTNPGKEWSEAHMYAVSKEGELVEHGVKLVASQTAASGPVIPHEIGHLLFHALLNYMRGVPMWIHEGFALAAEPGLRKAFMRRLAQEAIEGEEATPFSVLLEISSYPEKRLDLFYALSFAVTEFVLARGKLRDLVRTARRGPQDADGQAKALGFPDAESFEEAWRRWMRGKNG